jgi:hypothetical protein
MCHTVLTREDYIKEDEWIWHVACIGGNKCVQNFDWGSGMDLLEIWKDNIKQMLSK